jgi:DNA-binding HxlR family transcriptional regulator
MIKEKNKEINSICPVRKGMTILGSKWSLLILKNLLSGKKRYSELKKAIPDVTEKMLIQRLRELEEACLIVKKDYKEIPPRVDYSITKRGQKAGEILPILHKIFS